MNSNQAGYLPALRPLASTLALGFKFLAWVNGIGVAAVLMFGVGIIQVELDPQWLRLPLAAFLGGLTFAALGLLWSYPVQASLLNQLASGRTRRTHWIPLFCTMVAYSLALLAFVFGCWFTLGLASLAYQGSGEISSTDDPSAMSSEQPGGAQEFIYNAKENIIRFF